MPEGHTLHRLAREMAELVGRPVAAASPQGRFDAAAVDGRTVVRVEAYGKHLLVDLDLDLDRGDAVHVHLGMRGKWLRFAPVTGPGLRQVRLRLAAVLSEGDDPFGPPQPQQVAWDLIAPSTCELLDPDRRTALLAALGPDPLRPEADPAEAFRRIRAFRGPIGAALMDQAVLAGVGNVFRAEALHACRVAPTRPASAVGEGDLRCLWDTLGAMMTTAVDDGRIITVDVPPEADRLAVPEEESRRVYKRVACADCGTPVVSTTIAGRTSYACPACQPD